jgi:hypothetical protein
LNGLVSFRAHHLRDVTPEHFGFGMTEPAFVSGTHELVSPFGVDERNEGRQRVGDDLELTLTLSKRFFRFAALGVVARKAARVDELAVPRIDVGADDHVLAAEARQDVRDDLFVDMKSGDRAPYVFLGRVAEQIELRPVGPEDGAVGADAVKSERSIVEEVAQLLFTAPQLFFFLAQLAQ